ncbi:MAG: serine protease [Acidimicrobiales bacterium]
MLLLARIKARAARRRTRRRRIALGTALIAVSVFNLVEYHDNATAESSVAIGDALTAQRPSPAVDASAPVVPSVRIIASGCDGTLYGSGVVISGDRVLTARHVVAGARRIVIETEDGRQRVARTVLVDREGRDAATVSVPGIGDAGTNRIQVARTEPERGDSVAITGHPEGGRLHIDYTTVSLFTARQPLAANGTRVMIVDDAFAEGVSGGPVTDSDGRVIGIAIGIERNSKVGIVTPTSGLGPLLAGTGDVLPPAC